MLLKRRLIRLFSLAGFALFTFGTLPLTQAAEHPGVADFVERAAAEHGLDADMLTALIAEGEYKQSIIDAITRPAEGKPWHEYRQIFLTDTRIRQGVEFWQANTALVDAVAAKFGVPPEVFLAIMGVETSYGRITGSYRVLDALVTLGFYYPRRAEFFSSELAEFVRLSREEQIPVREITGSYAGAMGLGQFIPSSYRAYAVDFDDDGRRDLWASLPDAVASVANYLHVHRWQPGSGIVMPVELQADADIASHVDKLKPELSIAEWRSKGVIINSGIDAEQSAALLKLDGADGPEYWLGLQNFYVITRYNRSPLYAMAVTQLSQALRAAYNDA